MSLVRELHDGSGVHSHYQCAWRVGVEHCECGCDNCTACDNEDKQYCCSYEHGSECRRNTG